MPLTHPKSFVAGLVLLTFLVWSLFNSWHQTLTRALHEFNLVVCPIAAAFCIWHAFRGQKPLFAENELYVSVTLGVTSLLLGLGQFAARVVMGPKYHIHMPTVLASPVFLAAAVYYFRCALREHRELAAQQPNPPFKMKSLS